MKTSKSALKTNDRSLKGAVQQTPKKMPRGAIYSFEWQSFSRGKDDNILARLSYRGGDIRKNDRGVVIANYKNRKGVVFKDIILPEKHPPWATIGHTLWVEALKLETRVNSIEGWEIRVTAPYLLGLDATIDLAHVFGNRFVKEHGCAIEVFIHKDSHLDHNGEIKNEGGHHIHFVITSRRLTETGFTEKARELGVQKAGYLRFWRQQWQDVVNKALEENGRTERVDCRSYKARGIDKEPTKPMWPSQVRKNRQEAEAARSNVSNATDSIGIHEQAE